MRYRRGGQALVALLGVILVIAITVGVAALGWRPQNIIAANPTPNLTATAVAVEPDLRSAITHYDTQRVRSLTCACDPGLAHIAVGVALANDQTRIRTSHQLIRRRTTIVHHWRIESIQLLTPTTATATLYRNVSEYIYQGLVPIRRVDGAYLDRITLANVRGVWKVTRVHTAKLSRVATAIASEPAATYQAAYILDDTSHHALFAINANQERQMASTAKVMTAVIALQRLSLNAVATVPAEALVAGTSAHLVAGERMRVRDLFYGMLLPSGNDAAVTLAVATAGSIPAFAVLMNAEAARLHLRHSHFVTPHGLDTPNQYTSAHDLALIAHILLQQPFLAGVVRTRFYHATSVDGLDTHQWSNLDQLLGSYPGAIGVKTGTTPGAGANLIASAVRGNHRIIAVLLGDSAGSRYYDATRLLNFGWRLLGLRA